MAKHFQDYQVSIAYEAGCCGYCKKHHKIDYYLLMFVPGIAGITASYILAEIGNLRPFNSFKQLASYVGFVPSMHQSGNSIFTTGPTPRANRHIRNLFIETGTVLLNHILFSRLQLNNESRCHPCFSYKVFPIFNITTPTIIRFFFAISALISLSI